MNAGRSARLAVARFSRLAAARGALAALALTLAIAAPPGSAPSGGAPRIPVLVFVSRAAPADRALVPGVGPDARTLVTGGRLMVRNAAGAVRELLPAGRFADVADPAVSFDARRVAFAGVAHRDSAWRIWIVNADGRGLRAVTRTPPGARADDFDPCWLPDGRLVFASTRWPLTAQGGGPVSNLYTVHPDSGGLERLTSDRNGAEEPSVDPRNGRIVYARWWTNRWLASERDRMGVTLTRSRAIPQDTVNVWHAISVLPNGDHGRLAGGDPRTRMGVAAYQPVIAADGTLVGVAPERQGFEYPAGRLRLQVFPGGFAAARAIAADGMSSACSPVLLPEGGVAFAFDPEGRGDFGIWAARLDGTGLTKLVDLPGTLELDPAPLVPRPLPPVASPPRELPMPEEPFRSAATANQAENVSTFRFDCMNVFLNGPVDAPFPDAPPIQRGVRIRFYAALARPGAAGGDTVILLRDAAVEPTGGVHVDDLPADVPMFEQLVDSKGRVLRSSMGPAHVPGFNSGGIGMGTQCAGCHSGHSALEVPRNYSSAEWINAAPSARVTATSVWPGTRPQAAVDRRARGPADSVGWVAGRGAGEKLRLSWGTVVEVRSVVLYAFGADSSSGTDLTVGDCEVRLYRGNREVERTVVRGPLAATGTRANCNNAACDWLEVIPLRVTGRVHGRAVAGLAEVEAIARIHQK